MSNDRVALAYKAVREKALGINILVRRLNPSGDVVEQSDLRERLRYEGEDFSGALAELNAALAQEANDIPKAGTKP